MASGLFVVLEGPEAVGKTTLAASLADRMRSLRIDPVLVREPGGTPVAEALRHELLNAPGTLSAGVELLYLVTARADLVARVIRPALEAGRVVLSDRYDLSTIAYQGAGRELPLEHVRWINQAATGGLVPDITLVLDVDPAIALERQRRAGKRLDRVERESAEFHRRVAGAYRAAAGPGVRHIQADGSAESVLEASWRALMDSDVARFQSQPL